MKKQLNILNICLILLGVFFSPRLKGQQKASVDSILNLAISSINTGDSTILKTHLKNLDQAAPNADQVFSFFKQHGAQIDRVMGNGYALGQQQAAIYRQYLAGLGKEQTVPDWKQIRSMLLGKYENTAEQPYLIARTNYHHKHGEFSDLAVYGEELRQKYPAVMSNYALNNFAFDAFKATSDIKVLNTVLKWSKQTITQEPNSPHYLDTYANLLHKLGQTRKAIPYEERAYSLADDNQKKEILPFLERMRAGKPTW